MKNITEYILPYFLLLGIYFAPRFVTIGHKRYYGKELASQSEKYSNIKWRYWGWSVFLIPLGPGIIYSGLTVAERLPEFKKSIIFMSILITISLVPLYQCIFALFTNAFPVGKNDGFVIGEAFQIRVFVSKTAILIILMLATSLICFASLEMFEVW